MRRRFALLLGDPPGLARRDDELPQEGLGQPAGVASRQAVAQLIPLIARGDLAQLLFVGGLVARRQLRSDGP